MSGYKKVYRAHIKTQFNPENFYFMAVRVLVADWYDTKTNLLEIPWHTSLLLKVSSWQPIFLALFILVDNLIGFCSRPLLPLAPGQLFGMRKRQAIWASESL